MIIIDTLVAYGSYFVVTTVFHVGELPIRARISLETS